MSRQIVEFFEVSIPEVLEQLISVGGAVVALMFYDPKLALVCLFLIVPAVVTNRWYTVRVRKLQRELNNQYENEYNVFGRKNATEIREYYREIGRLQVATSDNEAINYSILRFFLLIVFIGTLYVSVDLDEFTTGDLYGVVAYIWTFITATEYIPYFSQRWISLVDVLRRVRVQTPDDMRFIEEDE
jgi:ABC-type multidrug transport system fused ATPase/permease subunit